MLKKIVMTLICVVSMVESKNIRADVQNVTASGTSGAYTFAVKLQSVETGCAQYADWWEVVRGKGELVYRRILVHSHPDTQPFTRSGGVVTVDANDIVYIRAHMNILGYVGDVFKGTVSTGFKKVTKAFNFPKDIEKQSPLPQGCLF